MDWLTLSTVALIAGALLLAFIAASSAIARSRRKNPKDTSHD